jgi:uncharacterized protein (DUF2384 family)
MTSSHYYDVVAPTFDAEAKALLHDVNRATELLSTSKNVPNEVEELVDQFDARLHARDSASRLASVDPYLVADLLGGGLLCLKALRHESPDLERHDLRLGLEQVRQALRNIVDETLVSDDRGPKELLFWLVETISVPQGDIARVVGVSRRTLQRWLSSADSAVPAGNNEARLRVVARIVNHLRHSFTGPGTLRWLERPNPQLHGAAPLTLLADESRFAQLVQLAATARSMTAT